MGVTTTKTNKPLNPRAQDASPLAYNRAALYSGKALSFDGVNDYVTIPDNAAADFGTGDFSISFIMKSSAAGNARVIDKRNNTSGYSLYINTAKELILELNDTTGNTGFNTSTIYADGELKHVVISADRNGNADFYINGKLDESVDISSKSGNLDSTSDLFIGADAPAGDSLYYNGQISGTKIFNTALTPAQIADLYNFPEKIVPTGVANTALKLWLPMMESAGTTAYDGSGNGNHGTINGATYVNGIGAPVAQTSVINWNKGVNIILDSEFTASSTNSPNLFRGFVRNSTTEESPFGTFDAVKMTEDGTNSNPGLVFNTNASNSNPHTLKAYIKANTATSIAFATNGATNPGNINVTTEWQAFEVTQSGANSNPHIGGFGSITQGSGIVLYVWHPQLQEASSAGPYVGTIGTAQTSDVLLPQGLTTGRDITGVNLFENVRKQSALNLDGQSWAEVHDNASLDVSPAMTMECWVDFSEIDSTSIRHFIVKPSGATWAAPYARYTLRASNAVVQWWFESAGYVEAYSVALTGWNHFAVTKDGTAEILYINGAQVDTATNNATITASAENLLLGQATTGTDPLDSQIAQPRIYNRALTNEEIQRNYNAGKNIYS